MRKTYHMSIDVKGVLDWPKNKLRKMFIDEKTGKHLSAEEAREYLKNLLLEGKEHIPYGNCPTFDYKSGCPGHEAKGGAA